MIIADLKVILTSSRGLISSVLSLPVRHSLYLFLSLFGSENLKEYNSIYCNKMVKSIQLIPILSGFQYTEK